MVEEDAGGSHESHEDHQSNTDQSTLANAVEFLDHFDAALDIVVGCARKIEMTRWPRLFDVVGSPQSLFEVSSSVIHQD